MPAWLEPKDCIQPLLGLLGSGFLGFFWFLSTIVASGAAIRKLTLGTAATHGVFATVTTLGGVFFTRWNAAVAPANGLFWVSGAIIGSFCAYIYVTSSVVNKVLAATGHNDRRKVLSLVKGTLLYEGANVAATEAIDSLRKWQNPDKELSRRAMARLHTFVHEARHSATREFGKIGKRFAESGTYEPDLSTYLEEVVALFRELLADLIQGGPGLWVALRRRNPDGNFVTIIRKGDVDDSARAAESKPVPEKKGLPALLKESMTAGPFETRGVIFHVPEDKKKFRTKWHKTKNDKRKEDLYLVAAPVTIRQVESDGKNLKTVDAFILYANHTNNAFPPWLCDIIRCCVDTVSTALSVGIQIGEELKRVQGASQPILPGGLVASQARAQASGRSTDDHAMSGSTEEQRDASVK